MNKDIEKKIILEAWSIFFDEEPENTDVAFEMACDDGWANIIKTAAKLLHKHNQQKKNDLAYVPAHVEQIKEKFGSLRMYISGGDYWTNGVVDMTEELSHSICEVSGAEGSLYRRGNWFKTLSEDIAKANDYVKV
jgi:hypothetical protein